MKARVVAAVMFMVPATRLAYGIGILAQLTGLALVLGFVELEWILLVAGLLLLTAGG